jgi:hypothetical protein
LLIGSGWAERLQGARRITVLEDAPFESLAEAYESAQRVINLNGANGASERALGGLSVGALVLSDQAPLLEAAFGATGALRLFDRRRPDTLIEALETDLPPSEAQDRADAGRAEVDRAHLWSHRVALLEEALARLAP